MAILATLVMAAIFIPSITVAQEDDFSAKISGPDMMVLGGKDKLEVEIEQGLSGTINYEVSVSPGGKVNPNKGTTTGNTFTVEITAPSEVGRFTATFKISSKDDSEIHTVTHDIDVVEAIALSVELINAADMAAKGVPVSFYVDDALIGVVNADIPAKNSKVVSYDWTGPKNGLSSGQHTLKVVVDPDDKFTEYIQFEDGSREYTTTFYVGDGGWGLANIILAIILVIFIVIVIFTYSGRSKKKKRKRRPRA